MNIQQLQYIIALDRYKNFTKASESCFITQATMSTMIKKLEEELNVIIFDRKSNPIITTDMGRVIIQEATKALEHIKNMTEIVNDETNAYEGTVKIGVIPTVANSLIPLVIQPIMIEFPKLEISISEMTTNNLINALKDNTIDFGIISTPIAEKGFDTQILYHEPLKVYGKLSYNKKYLLTSDIQKETHWLLEDGHCIKDQIMSYCSLESKGNHLSNLRFQSSSFETLLKMVDIFGGLTIIPQLYALSLPEETQNKIFDFEGSIPVREISLISYRSDVKPKLGEALALKIKDIVSQILKVDLKKSVVLKSDT